jgi:hypothetical protein
MQIISSLQKKKKFFMLRMQVLSSLLSLFALVVPKKKYEYKYCLCIHAKDSQAALMLWCAPDGMLRVQHSAGVSICTLVLVKQVRRTTGMLRVQHSAGVSICTHVLVQQVK